MKKLTDTRPKKIAVFRALQLGDMLCSVPAIRALKHALPEAEITLLGLPWAASFVQRFSNYFTRFIHFPGFPGLPEQAFDQEAFRQFAKKISIENFDLILQLHGNGSIINPMLKGLKSKMFAGYCEESGNAPDLFMEYPEGIPEIERHVRLINFLGIPERGKHLEFPVSQEEKINFKMLSKELRLKRKEYVCVHPGARDVKRWWSPEKFAFIADNIAQRGYQVVLTGTAGERKIVNRVEDLMEYPAINMAGKTDLGSLALLIKNAKMIFSNDTGVSHVAAAVKTPSVVVFLTSDPKRWAPLNKDLHRIILPEHSENMKMILKKTEHVLYDEPDAPAMEKEIIVD